MLVDHIVAALLSQSSEEGAMPIRLRKLVGAVALIVLVVT